MSTDSSRILPSYSDYVTSFTIKSSRVIGAFTFLDFFQSQLTRVDLSFLLLVMTLKSCFFSFLVDLFKTAVAV